jgi:uncharacterized membrane protein
MSELHLWAIGYENKEKAEKAREAISQLAWGEGRAGKYLLLQDVAIAVRNADGSYTLDHKSISGAGNIVGATAVGFLAGLTVGAAFTGAAIGAVLGTAGTAMSAASAGIGDDFIRQIETVLKPGTAALFVLDDTGEGMDMILQTIRGLGGTVLKTNVDAERLKLIQSALSASAKST